MSNLLLILLILIPITIILLSGLIFFIMKSTKVDRRNKRIEKYKNSFDRSAEKRIDDVMTRISGMVRNEKQHKKNFRELEKLASEINEQETIVEETYLNIASSLKRASNRSFKEQEILLDKEVAKLLKLIREFDDTSMHFTQQNEFIEKRFILFESKMREAIEVYRNKRIQLQRISDEIDRLSNEIKSVATLFKRNLKEGRNREAQEILSKYEKLVYKYVLTVSEAPYLEMYLYKVIPEKAILISEQYKKRKQELSAQLNHLNFRGTLELIAKELEKARRLYLQVNFEKTKELVIKIFRTLDSARKMVDHEIVSRNIFMQNFKMTIEIAKDILNKYITIKKHIRSLIEGGYSMPTELNSLLSRTKEASNDLDETAISFRDSIKDKAIPFSSKINRMKMLLQKMSAFVELLNDALYQTWSINIESSIVKNKFMRSEAAINEILSNIRKNEIIMSDRQKKDYDYISSKMNEIAIEIENDKINKETTKKVKELMENVSSFYSYMAGDLQIAEIVRNLISELSPKRASNERLNVTLNSVERAYLDGDYANALNIIISELEKEG